MEKQVEIRFKKLDEKAVVPSKAHKDDSGFDLTFITIKKVVGDVIYFGTGIAVQPEPGYYFDVVPRSSISKWPLSMANSVGIIDRDYTGEIIIPVRVHHASQGGIVKNVDFPNGIVTIQFDNGVSKPPSINSLSELILYKKPKMFQMILRKNIQCSFVEKEFGDTDRGSGGFGSTDSKQKVTDSEPKEEVIEKIETKTTTRKRSTSKTKPE